MAVVYDAKYSRFTAFYRLQLQSTSVCQTPIIQIEERHLTHFVSTHFFHRRILSAVFLLKKLHQLQEDITEFKIKKRKKSSENATEMWEKNVQEGWWNSPSGIGADTEIPNESIFLKTCHTQSEKGRQPVYESRIYITFMQRNSIIYIEC